jgi:hypothetical protein
MSVPERNVIAIPAGTELLATDSILVLPDGGDNLKLLTPEQFGVGLAREASGAYTPLAYARAVTLEHDIMDGATHPLSAYFGTLAAAQEVFPHAVALSDELFWACLQACFIDGLSSGAYGHVVIPGGVGLVNRTLAPPLAHGMLIEGSGAARSTGYGTRLLWRGNDTDTFLRFSDVSRSLLRNISLVVDSASYPCDTAVAYENVSGGITPTANALDNVVIQGTAGYILRAGVHFRHGGVDGNNDLNVLNRCEITGYNRAGVLQTQSQSKGNHIRNCSIAAYSLGSADSIGVSLGWDSLAGIPSAVGVSGGSCHIVGGTLSSHQRADVYVYSPVDTLTITEMQSEGSARLLETEGSSSAIGPTIINSVRWSNAGHLHADGEFIKFRHGGPLVIVAGVFQDTNPPSSQVMRIRCDGAGPDSLTIIGTAVTTLATSLFTAGGGTGNLIAGTVPVNGLVANLDLYNIATNTHTHIPHTFWGKHQVGTTGAELTSRVSGTKTWDPGSVADIAETTTTVTVTGAALGDVVTGLGFSLSLQGMKLTGYVSAANTVTVVLRNDTGGALDLASGTLRAVVEKYA